MMPSLEIASPDKPADQDAASPISSKSPINASNMAPDDDEYCKDDWPQMTNGSDWDGKDLMSLTTSGMSPFAKDWDIHQLFHELEERLGSRVKAVPCVEKGSNNYGFQISLADGREVVARLSRSDVNLIRWADFELAREEMEVKFETSVHGLLCDEPGVPVSRVLFSRTPTRHAPECSPPLADILGRSLIVSEKTRGRKAEFVWNEYDDEVKFDILTESAAMRAALFRFQVPIDFVQTWLLPQLFKFKPSEFSQPVALTRDFCLELFSSKIEATIRNPGDQIGWDSDNEVVGPIAFAAKQPLLRVIPHILPTDEGGLDLYRLVLDHGDVGTHNMLANFKDGGESEITSLFDWETGCIVPALLSDPLIAVTVDLALDEDCEPAYKRDDPRDTEEDHEQFRAWTAHYYKKLFEAAPEYQDIIKAGKHARHLWFALRDWRGQDPEGFFGELGEWAERILKEVEQLSEGLRELGLGNGGIST